MSHILNNKDVNFEDLKRAIDSEKKNIYSEDLLIQIQNGNFDILNTISLAKRNSKEYMEPLLFAVKNSKYDTYEIFEFYGDDLKSQDITILKEIVEDEPELIKNTVISKDEAIILQLVQVNPEVIAYISKELKNDDELIEEFSKMKNDEIMMYVVNECDVETILKENSKLASNEQFMREAIKQDENMLEYLSDELKDNYDFIKETAEENYGVVEYIVKNVEDFEVETITVAQDVSKEFTVEDCIKVIDEISEKSDDERYKKVKEKVKEKGIEDVRTMKWVTAMVAQSDKVSPDMLKKVLNYSVLEMSRIKKDLTEDGKEKVSIENAQQLITPQILNRLKQKAIEQGLEIDEDLENRFKEYEEFYKEYMTKLKEKKKENREIKSPEDIEKITKDASLKGIKEETEKIRENVTIEKNTTNEIGEQKNDGYVDERT